MTFCEFRNELEARGAVLRQIWALDRAGRECADDAHRSMFEAGELREDGIITDNDFHSFCAHMGRGFVLDNWGELFCPDGYIWED